MSGKTPQSGRVFRQKKKAVYHLDLIHGLPLFCCYFLSFKTSRSVTLHYRTACALIVPKFIFFVTCISTFPSASTSIAAAAASGMPDAVTVPMISPTRP